MKRILACLAILLLVGSLAFADNKVALTVKCNVTGAQVYLNGRLAGYAQPNFSQLLAAGDYEITVKAKGYQDFVTKVRIGRDPVIINATLGGPPVVQPPQVFNHNLTVSANVNGADVYVNGNLAGKTPFNGQVPQGSYTVVVKAPGYNDYTQNVVVNGPTRVNANLQGMTYQLSVTAANVHGATVFVNGAQVGQSPYQAFLLPGSYTVTIKAPGFIDYQVQVNVNGPQAVNAVLQPMSASWQFIIPDGFLNRDIRQGQSRYIEVYLDGIRQPDVPGSAVAAGQMTAGRHVFRFVIGGMAVEAQVDAQAGRGYLLEPYIGINVK
jgi:archaellum component FlaF (FlaF/FlaG flagellin family)